MLTMPTKTNTINTPQQYQNKVQTILPVMEQFYTLQGEGFHTGKAAYFIRLAGCDVGCFWCDVKESWKAEDHPDKSVEAVVQLAKESKAPIAVVTGGEPLIYNLDYLTQQLKEANLQTNIETSGAYPLSGHWDWICLSPKKFKVPTLEVVEAADELKIVVYNKSDFEWAEKFAAQVKDECLLFLQPEWSRQEQMLPLMIEYVKANPKWRVSLQTHKFMDIP